MKAEFIENWLTAQDGLQLYWRDYGDPLSPGVPVLCLAGLTRNCKDFHDLAVRLAPRRRVLCPDYRGRGRSQYDDDWHNYEPRILLQDVRHLLSAAGVHRCVIIGTSLGGILAMGLGVMTPTVVAGVVLNDIGPDPASDGLERIIDYIGRDRPQPDWETAEAHLKACLPNLSFKDEASWRTLTSNTFRRGEDGLLHFDWDVRLVEVLRQRHRTSQPDLWALFRSLANVPMLVVRGGRSDVLSEQCVAAMIVDRRDRLDCVTVPETGHAPALDEDNVISAIDALLARVDAIEASHISVGRAFSLTLRGTAPA